MDSPVKPSPQLRFLEEMANHYVFTGDTRTVFLTRFDEQNAKKVNIVLVSYIDWSRTPEDGAQKLQDELKKICHVLEKEGCPIEKTKRGRQPKGRSPWEQAFKWLWQSKFPEWQQSQTINADNSETNSIEERLFRATEQLKRRGFSALVGIQALEAIAKDSPRYHWKIMELLATFVRNAPRRKEEEGIPDDIQAALSVIGQRDTEKDPENQKLDLSNADIAGAKLGQAKLQGAFLKGANLQGAYLFQADLQRANLIEANLQEAFLKKANLQEASLHQAKLRKADCQFANLQEAFLVEANLQEAVLYGANLQGAYLDQANLQQADLGTSKLRMADLRDTNLQEAYLQRAKLQRADLRGANLQEADLIEAELQGTLLWRANLQGAVLQDANLEGAQLWRANLEGTNFTDAINLTQQQIDQSTRRDSTTILPDYLK